MSWTPWLSSCCWPGVKACCSLLRLHHHARRQRATQPEIRAEKRPHQRKHHTPTIIVWAAAARRRPRQHSSSSSVAAAVDAPLLFLPECFLDRRHQLFFLGRQRMEHVGAGEGAVATELVLVAAEEFLEAIAGQRRPQNDTRRIEHVSVFGGEGGGPQGGWAASAGR
jgi:hypothetical protein